MRHSAYVRGGDRGGIGRPLYLHVRSINGVTSTGNSGTLAQTKKRVVRERYCGSPSATVGGGQITSGRCHGKYEKKGNKGKEEDRERERNS